MTDKKDKRYDYIVYKLCCDDTDLFYIGSTRNMVQRKKNHKCCCHNPKSTAYNQKKYETMREFGGWDNWRLCPLELMKNSTKLEAEMREEVVRMELKAMLNSQKVTRGNLSVQDYKKQYREENIDRFKEYKKKYAEKHKDHIKDYIKHYYEENKEQRLEYAKQYREENKETLASKAKEKYDCECGGKYVHGERARHFRTQLHQKYGDSLKNGDQFRDQIREQRKQKFNCECGSKIHHAEKTRHFKTQLHQKYVDSLENET